MPRPKTDEQVRRVIYRAVENNPSLTAKSIRKVLVAGHKELAIPELAIPSERTISRIKNEFLERSSEDRIGFRYASWPESMLDGALPWEAGSALLELRHCYRGHASRPTVSVAQWFWRITSAAPDAPLEFRVSLAQYCADLKPGADEFQAVEAYLEFTPWQSKESKEKYEQELKKGVIPSLPEDVPTMKRFKPDLTPEDISRARREADERLQKQRRKGSTKASDRKERKR